MVRDFGGHYITGPDALQEPAWGFGAVSIDQVIAC